ncbi:copper-binding protein [Ferrovibrio sp.]|uniref:copper-binding protein n=1 Tax=Ferrovibrio sp. TaxID=1917215 RepID=UPI001B60732D|nr:copper-binding protein [Ferrovibrio sp.]MBP7065153.1 copper-binding protein [Ferrovibrio sp.]
MKKIMLAAALYLGLLGTGPDAFAQMTGKGEGEIRKVDKDASKITIKHGPIEAMDMPGMTMVFQVKDPGLLDRAKVGETVNFTVTKDSGAMVLTSVEPKK